MTHSFRKGYSGNLCIFVDPIIFDILFFFQCDEMIIDYCVPRYKYTYIFKTMCKFDPCFWDQCVFIL